MSKLFFKTPGASNPSSHTRTDSTDHDYPKSFTKLVAGTASISTLGKRSEDFKTGKRNMSRPLNHSSAFADHVKTTSHNATSSGTILTFERPARLTSDHCKVKETLFIQELQRALNTNVSSEKLL